jgi:hypothetical protein
LQRSAVLDVIDSDVMAGSSGPAYFVVIYCIFLNITGFPVDPAAAVDGFSWVKIYLGGFHSNTAYTCG